MIRNRFPLRKNEDFVCGGDRLSALCPQPWVLPSLSSVWTRACPPLAGLGTPLGALGGVGARPRLPHGHQGALRGLIWSSRPLPRLAPR